MHKIWYMVKIEEKVINSHNRGTNEKYGCQPKSKYYDILGLKDILS